MSRNRVRIHNPIPGCAPFTSTRRAQHFVRRGLAFMRDDDSLEFFGPGQGFYSRLAEFEFNQAVTEGRGDRVYWNGSSGHHKTKKPGQARS